MSTRAFRHLETTPVIVKPCHRCGTAMLTGLAEGIHAYVDAVPVGPAGEIAALLDGRQTYTLRPSGLIQRDAGRRTDPNLTGPILADHNCPRRPT